MKVLALALVTGLLAANQVNRDSVLLYIGTTDKSGDAAIRLASLHLESGEITVLETIPTGPGPGYLRLSPDKKALYAVTGDHKINAFKVDKNGRLLFLNNLDSEGLNPCHVSVSPDGKQAYLANYTGGSFTAYRLSGDKSLSGVIYREQYEGKGPHTRRQEKAHAHSAVPTPDGRFVLVADLGTDKLMNYQVDKRTGELAPHPKQPFYTGIPGAGPRHLVVHPSGKWLYLLNELDATITAASIDSEGVIQTLAVYKTLPETYTGTDNTSAAIRLHPNGGLLYASNRGYDAVHGFRIGADGRLTPVGEARQGISTPRDFNIDPSGKVMVIANLKTNDFAVYGINGQTGALTFRKQTGSIKEPSCIEFL